MDNCVLGVRIYQCICWLNVQLDLNFNVDPNWHLRYAWRVFPGSPENRRYPIQYSYPKSCRSAQFCQRDGKRKSLASLFRLHFCTLLVFLDLSGVFWKVFRLVLCILCCFLESWVVVAIQGVQLWGDEERERDSFDKEHESLLVSLSLI